MQQGETKAYAAQPDRLPLIGALPKKAGIALFSVLMTVLAAIVLFHHNPLADPGTEQLKKTCNLAIIGIVWVLFIVWYDKLMVLPVELWGNRVLIKRLSVNDFKKRYAGSYFGIVWALLQPVVTVLMYYFIFDVIFGTKSEAVREGIEVPYVLFLTAGLVPWFYFQEALSNGTTSLLEYNYLVKKVVFKISILPLIKIIAATFIHVFFIGLLLVLASVYGYYPGVYTLQILYYLICEFMLVLSLSYLTCSVAVFFRDIMQIIAIILQVGQWATPILWNIEIIPAQYQWIIKLNPMVYIVNGYRMAICSGGWFFEHFYSTTYFWIVTIGIFCIGSLLFKRSKTHFADIL